MRLMYSEEEDGKYLLENGFTDGYKWSEALAVAKYYRHVLGYGNARIKTELTKFLQEHEAFFNGVLSSGRIKRLVKKSEKEFVYTKDPVIITRSEIETIRTVKNFKWQLILLAMIVIAKRKRSDTVWLSDWKYIRGIISKRVYNRDIVKCITYCYQIGLIGEPTDHQDLHKLLFLSSDSPVITINNDKEILLIRETYMKFCGGEIIYCKNCEREIIRNGRTHKYCEDCWEKRNRTLKLKWWNKTH